MTYIINFIERLYNSIRYNGFYIILALLFPIIIYKLDAGGEIIVSMTENGFSLNIGLSILTFSILCLSVWCIPTLAVSLFQSIINWRSNAALKGKNVDNNRIKNCLFNQLVNVYNGKDTSGKYCHSDNKIYRPQLPVRYFAVAPWVLFILTCLKVLINNSAMTIGLIVIIASIISINLWKNKLLNKATTTRGKNNFLRKYAFLIGGYFLTLLALIFILKLDMGSNLLKWLLCILNFIFLLVFYGFLLFLENLNLEKHTDKEGKPLADLSFRISNINYRILLIYLISAIIAFYYLDQYELIQYISPVNIIVTMCSALIIFFELFFTSQLLLIHIVTQPTCNHHECALHECKISFDDSKSAALKAYRFVLIGLIFVIVNLYFFSSANSHRIRTIAAKPNEYIPASERSRLIDYFQQWVDLQGIKADDTVYLISGQGGGSRAAAWFFMNMTDLNNRNPDFFRKVFSISTVSGSTTGANMFLASQYFGKKVDSAEIDPITSGLYGRNYMSSSFYGLLLGDFLESLLDRGNAFPRDRNFHLQKEELAAFNETFHTKDGAAFFEKDYYTPYLTRKGWPLFFINTTIVNFGTRAFFSPVRMDSVSMARDLYGEFKNNSCNNGDNLPTVTCVNQSQAFPILSAYNYLDCIGRLVDGGLSENSGCATTLEVYQKLRKYCDTGRLHNIRFVCLNITNGSPGTTPKVSFEKASIFNTATAALHSPFDGNETYAFRNLEQQIRYLKNNDRVENLSLDTSITLTRTLSKQSVDRMYRQMLKKHFKLK